MNRDNHRIQCDRNRPFNGMFLRKEIPTGRDYENQRDNNAPEFDHLLLVRIDSFLFRISERFIQQDSMRFTVTNFVKDNPVNKQNSSQKNEIRKRRCLYPRDDAEHYSHNKSQERIRQISLDKFHNDSLLSNTLSIVKENC